MSNVEEMMRALFSTRRTTIETLLEIEDKNRQLVPMRLYPIQADIIETSSWRDVYVKPGQIGATAVQVGDFMIDNITINGTVSVIISYDEFSSQRLILKAKRYDSSLRRRIPSIPRLDHKSATELSWEDKDTNFYSTMYIFSARSYVLGRGETIHNLLLDEFAFYPPGTHEEIFASAVQRVPLKAGTKVRIQSTANGEDNPFCEMYRAAKEGKEIGKSVYKAHFYPWFIHPEYIMLVEDIFCLPGDDVNPLPNLQSDEVNLLRLLVDTYSFSEFDAMAKIRWRRYKIAEMASLRRIGTSAFIFPQEFPEDDVTCFLVAGGQAYPPEIVNDKMTKCYPAPIKLTLTNPKTGTSAQADIWFDREKDFGYVMGIDPGKGKTSESVGQVWHFTEGYVTKEGKEISPIYKHCATVAGFYDEWEMAEYCKQLGHYYNDAVLAPEDNLDIVSHLRDYPELYYREDVRNGTIGRAVGWQTNVSTKPYMITEFSRHLDYIESYDKRIWTQCRNIRRDSSSKGGIKVVGADDHHDATAISIVCRTAQQLVRGFIGQGGWSDEWGK